MAFRSWSFQMAAPPAPPMSAEALMARDGHVDPLLSAVLARAVQGRSDPVEGPEGRQWRVASSWIGDLWHVVALDVSEGVVAEDRARHAEGVRELLAAVDPALQLAGPRWAIDGQGDVVLGALEREAVEEALDGERVVSEEGWAVLPLSSEGHVFAALIGRAANLVDVQRLEALAIVLAEPIFRRLVRAV
jgi:hypothetical protein